ncbi:MAG: hydrogenase expression protein HypE, partial [Alphaproteobacteria bacterium]
MPQSREMIDVTAAALRGGPVRPRQVSVAEWESAAAQAASGTLVLMGLWAAGDRVQMALMSPGARTVGVLEIAAEKGRFPSVGALHAPAQRPERAIRDLHGLVPEGAPDDRPWLDHGRWGLRHPLAAEPQTVEGEAEPATAYRFLPVEGESLHQVPVGPVHAGIIEPGHFRFTAQGET